MTSWILILTICSGIDFKCLPPLAYTDTVYNSWSECSLAGYKIANNVILAFPPKTIENNRLAGRFYCKKIQNI